MGLLHKTAMFWEAGGKTTAQWNGLGQTRQTANTLFLIVYATAMDEISTHYFKRGLNALDQFADMIVNGMQSEEGLFQFHEHFSHSRVK